MALDPVAQSGKAAFNNNYVLMDSVTATANSVWVPVQQGRHFTFYTSGIVSGDEVTLTGFVDDSSGEPAAGVHGEIIGAVLTVDGVTARTERPDFIKARLTATAGGGTVSVFCKVGW